MFLIDSHTHLYAEDYKDDLKATMERAFANGVYRFLLPGINKHYQEAIKNMAASYPEVCFPMIGLHPTEIFDNYREELSYIQQELEQKNSYIAIGETGLDLYWDTNYIEQQKISFRQHIEWAIHYQLPLSLHIRKAFQEAFLILEDYQSQNLKGVFHCFSGSIEQAKSVINRGFLLGIGGVVTYKNGRILKEVVDYFPLDYMVLETDAPWLSPEPYRGQRNESAHIIEVAKMIAQIKHLPLEQVAEQTTLNCYQVFHKIKKHL